MNKKKILIPVVTAAAAVCAFGGYRVYQDQHSVVDVIPLSSLDAGYMGDSQSLYGMVYDSANQSITLDGTATVSEVYVTEGQEVKAGDRLLAYDVRDLELSVEMKKLAVEQAQNQLQGAQSRLQLLKNTKPREEVVIPTAQPTPEPTSRPVPDKNENGLYPYVEDISEAYAGDGTGMDSPLRFACSTDALISMKVINEAKNLLSDERTAIYLSFEGYALNEGEVFAADAFSDRLETEWKLKITADSFADEETGAEFALSTHSEEEKEPETTAEPVEIVDEEPQGYTAEELAVQIRDTEASIRSLDLDVRRKQLDLSDSEKALSDGVVYAKKDGIVTKVSDPANPPQDGSAFLIVSAQGGTVIQGQVAELMLDQLKTGDTLTVSDWNTGMTYDAIVQSIDTVPAGGDNYYGGNPNESYYNFYAVISDTTDMSSYSGVEMTLPAEDNSQGYWIQTAYVRKDSSTGQYYVMKDDGNGRLMRQNVKTGATMYGYAINVIEGLNEDDKIAFPYGKNVKEGVRTQESDGGDMYG